MPETDIVLGGSDVEVRADNLAVTNSEGQSTVRADQVAPGVLVLEDDNSYLTLNLTNMVWENDVGVFTMAPSQVFLPSAPGGDSTSVTADLVSGREQVRAENVAGTNGRFLNGTFGGGRYVTEEPEAGTVEVLDDQGDQAVLLDGSRGVVETSGGDVAEYFPNGTDESFDGGEVVGLDDGEVVGLEDGVVTDAVAEYDDAFVVASSPMLLGNRNPQPDADSAGDDHVPVALLGQVPVRVAADVEAGDRLVATADGRAVPADDGDDAPTVGRALESATAGGTATTLVGCAPAGSDEADDRVEALEAALAERDDRIGTLEAENEALRERLAAVEDRLGTVEDRLAATEGAAGTPADD